MDWVYALAIFLLVILLAVLLGWAQTTVKSAVARTFIWIGAILLLLVVRFFDGQPFVFIAIVLLAIWEGLNHLPRWVGYAVTVLAIGHVLWRGLMLIAENIDGIAREVERANARIALMESSITDKLRDIERRLPEDDEPPNATYF